MRGGRPSRLPVFGAKISRLPVFGAKISRLPVFGAKISRLTVWRTPPSPLLCNPCKLMLDNIVLQCQQSFLFLVYVGNPHNPCHMAVWVFLHDYLLDYLLLAEIMGITNMTKAHLTLGNIFILQSVN